MDALAQGLTLVLLHATDGHEILINRDSVITMHAGIAGKKNEYLAEGVRCYINTSDGKFISVVETCEQVRDLIRQSEQPR
jgi:hypothetical protein